MRRILRRREIVADDWQDLAELSADEGELQSLIVPFNEFMADGRHWRTEPAGLDSEPINIGGQGGGRRNRITRLGVRVAPADAIEELAAHLQHLALVAIEFPSAAEGRGFSQARMLRTRFQFGGELRAVGAGVKQDLLFLMARCGIDSFELAAGQSHEAALSALQRYSVAYQPGASVESIRMQRYLAPGTTASA